MLSVRKNNAICFIQGANIVYLQNQFVKKLHQWIEIHITMPYC